MWREEPLPGQSIAEELAEIDREQLADEVAAAQAMTPEQRVRACLEFDALVCALQDERVAAAARRERDREKDGALEWMARI